MAIYIKSVELPKSCWRCTLGKTVNCVISLGEESSSDFRDIRHPNCPLVYIHEPHGRLIDAEAFYEYVTNQVGGVDCGTLLNNEITPTVIERSEQDDRIY